MGTKQKSKKVTSGGGGSSATKNNQSTIPSLPFGTTTLYLTTAAIVGAVYVNLLSTCFEGRYWWSNPNYSLEQKEVAFLTEQSLYYSYFKDAVQPNTSLLDVIHKYMNDDTVEHPRVINALQRFNVWPEVILAAIYRAFASSSIPIDFYVQAVFIVNGLLAASVYLAAAFTSQHWLAGFVAIAVPLASWFDSTRVWGSVPLRECWSIPFLYAQVAVISFMFSDRDNKSSVRVKIGSPIWSLLVFLVVSSLLTWQLTSSVMALQVASIFVTFLCGYMSSKELRAMLFAHVTALAITGLFMFGNKMLLVSPYMCCTLGILLVTGAMDQVLGEAMTPYPGRLVRNVITGVVAIFASACVKFGLGIFMSHSDDAHMANLLKAKFGIEGFQDFHTSIYLAMDSFLSMRPETAWHIASTGSLPMAGITCIVTTILLAFGLLGRPQSLSTLSVFHLFYGLMHTGTAMLFFRLRILWMPYVGIIVAMLGAPEINNVMAVGPMQKIPSLIFRTLTLIGAGVVLFIGSNNFNELRMRVHAEEEFTLPSMIELVKWLKANTPPDAVIAGDMSTMASVKMMANRRIANHPHYEDSFIRHKTFQISHWYAFRTIPDVHKIFSDYHIDYIVNHHPPCKYKLGRQQLSYADYVELGENGDPAPKLERSQEKCCLAVAHPEKRKGYFELVRDSAEWPVYRVLPRKQKQEGDKAQ